MRGYRYLNYPEILSYIDELQYKVLFVRINVLDNEEYSLKSIEGYATDGSININGSSAVRRTGSVTVVTRYLENSQRDNTNLEIMNEVTNMKTLLAMNKRVSIEVGIENSGQNYQEFNIFWFPLGKFIISNAQVSYNQQGIIVSLNLNDKMALLNGEAGGTIDTAISDLHLNEDGSPIYLYDIIEALLVEFGDLKPYEYVISDIPREIKNIYSVAEKEINVDIGDGKTKTFLSGEPIGYAYAPFYWPGSESLTTSAGESVVSVLEKIKNKLGNYEFFFDVQGIFHFQEIKNYENEGSSIDDLTAAINEKYFTNTYRGMSKYSFADSKIVTAYANNPQYNLIKNDYVIWGKIPQTEISIKYHLIIADLPNEKNYWQYQLQESDDEWKAVFAKSFTDAEDMAENVEWYLNGSYAVTEDGVGILIEKSKEPPLAEVSKGNITLIGNIIGQIQDLSDDDWRIKMYLSAIEKTEKERKILDKEVLENIPLMFAPRENGTGEHSAFSWREEYKDPSRSNLTYYLDGLNTANGEFMDKVPIQDFGFETIGKRTKVITDDDVNCLFADAPPNIWIKTISEEEKEDNTSQTSDTEEEQVKYIEAELENGTLIVPESAVTPNLIKKSAYDTMRSVIHESLGYSNNINLTTLPIYHLDVNQRITVDNYESDIHGDFVINSINIPLNLNGTMTINARRAIERV